MTHRPNLGLALILTLALLGLPQAAPAWSRSSAQPPSVFGTFDNPWSHWPPRSTHAPGVIRTPGVATPGGFVPFRRHVQPQAAWVPEHWAWNGFTWVWVPGHWEPGVRRW